MTNLTTKFAANEMPECTNEDYISTRKFMAAFTDLIEMNDLTAIRMLRAVNKAMTIVNEKAMKQREYRRAQKLNEEATPPELDASDLAFAEAQKKAKEAREKKEAYEKYMKECGAE